MDNSQARYDFDGEILRELHAARARLAVGAMAPASSAVRRRPGPRMLPAGAIALAVGAAAAAVGVTTLGMHSQPAAAPAPARPATAAYLTAKLSAALADEDGYVITCSVRQVASGEKVTSWTDPATGGQRLLLTSANGAPEIAEGIVTRGVTSTVTTVDYARHTVTTRAEPAAVIQSDARLGVSVPSPSEIRNELRSATLVREGQAEVAGHHTYRLRMTVPPASQKWFPGDDVELYADTSTYRLVRITISHNGRLLDTDELVWTSRSSADLSQTRLTVPAGFTRR